MAYISALVSDYVPSYTSTDVDSDSVSIIDYLTSLHTLIKSSLMVHEKTNVTQGAFFEVPGKHKGQKPILFERIAIEPMACESSKTTLNLLNSLITSQMHTE